VIYGLGAALGWGLADFGAAVVGRRVGSFATVVLAQIAGFAGIATVYVLVRPAWTGSIADVALLGCNAVFATSAYLLLYRGLELGPVALVSPIAAAFAVITIAFAIAFLGESLHGFVLAGALVTVLGVVLTATDTRKLAGGARMSQAGVPYALAASFLFGVATLVMGYTAQRIGWVTTVFVGRTFSVTIMIVAATVRRPELDRDDRVGILGAVAVGLVDIAGISLYSRGVEIGLVSIVTAASATFTLIPVVAGIWLLRERPAPSQLLGIVVVVGGLLLLGLGG